MTACSSSTCGGGATSTASSGKRTHTHQSLSGFKGHSRVVFFVSAPEPTASSAAATAPRPCSGESTPPWPRPPGPQDANVANVANTLFARSARTAASWPPGRPTPPCTSGTCSRASWRPASRTSTGEAAPDQRPCPLIGRPAATLLFCPPPQFVHQRRLLVVVGGVRGQRGQEPAGRPLERLLTF